MLESAYSQPYWDVFDVKIGIIGNFLLFYPSRNAIIRDWYPTNQTA